MRLNVGGKENVDTSRATLCLFDGNDPFLLSRRTIPHSLPHPSSPLLFIHLFMQPLILVSHAASTDKVHCTHARTPPTDLSLQRARFPDPLSSPPRTIYTSSTFPTPPTTQKARLPHAHTLCTHSRPRSSPSHKHRLDACGHVQRAAQASLRPGGPRLH